MTQSEFWSAIHVSRAGIRNVTVKATPTDLVMKHIDKLKSSGGLQIEDRSEAAKKMRKLMFGKYAKEQLKPRRSAARDCRAWRKKEARAHSRDRTAMAAAVSQGAACGTSFRC